MLGKLIKHEWRSVWKVLGGVNLFLLLYTFVGILTLHSSLWYDSNFIIETLLHLAGFFYFVSIFVISFTVIIYIAVRFYRNLYTDEGYLMHTLPVSQRDLLLSKLLVAFIWSVITGIVIAVSIFALVLQFDVDDILYTIFAQNLIARFKETFGISIFHGIILALTGSVVSAFQYILMIYTSISFGQLFQKHKVLGSILSYIGIGALIRILNSVFTAFVMLNARLDTRATLAEFSTGLLPYYYFSIIESIILCILFFFLTEYLMKKKLNLD